MKLPVDVKSVVEEAVDIEAARCVPLSASVLIDETAPADLIAHVRSLFASAATHARITVGYLGSAHVTPSEDDDMAVIIAGLDPTVGSCAASIRQVGVPVMVAATMPEQVRALAQESGFPIPEGDLIAPELTEDQRSQAQEAFGRFFDKISAPDAIDLSVEDEGAPERATAALAHANNPLVRMVSAPVKRLDLGKILGKTAPAEPEKQKLPEVLSPENTQAFNNRMGDWVIATCREKRLSFALAFPFVARPLSIEAVNATAVQNAGIGVVTILPGADMPLMTLNQAKMLLQIAAAYGQPMTIERAKELSMVVGAAFACRSLARNVVGLVPMLGWAVKGAIGYTGTVAMGRAAIEYFENGGGALGVTGLVVSMKNAVAGAVAKASGAPLAEQESQKADTSNQEILHSAKELGATAAAVSQKAAQLAGPLAGQAAHDIARSFSSGVKAMMK